MLCVDMRPPRYPLEPLARLREDQVEAAVRGLAAAVAGRGAAEDARRTAEHRRDAHAEAAALVRESERLALRRGELHAGDLARAGAWEARVASEHEAMASEVRRALGAEAQARDAERKAQRETASRKADAEAVATDQARWHDALRKKGEAREEEAAEEAFRRRP
jgi:hypothetical protein